MGSIELNLAHSYHLIAMGERHFERIGTRAPEYTRQLCILVFEGKINVVIAARFGLAYLATYFYQAKRRLQNLLDTVGEFAYAEYR